MTKEEEARRSDETEEKGLTVLGKKIVRPPDHELPCSSGELLELAIRLGSFQFRRVRISTSTDGELVVLSEVEPSSEVSRVGKVEKGEELGEIVLKEVKKRKVRSTSTSTTEEDAKRT